MFKTKVLQPNQMVVLQKQPNIIFEPLTIFDESEKGITFLHRWANAIHINTKQLTLKNESAFFSQ